jgi:hypothetical protein
MVGEVMDEARRVEIAREAPGPDDRKSVLMSPGEVITDPDRAEALGLTADAKRMRGLPVSGSVVSLGPADPCYCGSGKQFQRCHGYQLFPKGGIVSSQSGAQPVQGGTKNDGGKERFGLIPPGPMREVAKVFTIGAAKYGDRNWEKGISFERLLSAAHRHLNAWQAGETHDPDDGQHHLSSVAWAALCLMELEKTKPEFDDRKPSGPT